MKTWMAGLLAAVLLAPAVLKAEAEATEKKPQYIGVEACGVCHKRKKTGDQLGRWRESKHAQAYATLASPEAKKIAAERGIADPQKADECLGCHVIQAAAEEIAPPKRGRQFRMEDGVQCETCHGPGSLYKSRKVMKNHDAAVAAGLVVPTEETCRQCHNEKSPTYKGFDFDERWAKISHPIPEKKKAGEKSAQ